MLGANYVFACKLCHDAGPLSAVCFKTDSQFFLVYNQFSPKAGVEPSVQNYIAFGKVDFLVEVTEYPCSEGCLFTAALLVIHDYPGYVVKPAFQ
ncbi:hypothetical protein SDC9_146965 [bioreactor metagenome]|uniref:Uncharacterized protein n=1 Tax=bioreactor metagenome TaxID=1076179 RepID=A0A645EER4_9ZZZZ